MKLNTTRTLRPNIAWLHLSKLRPDWGPWPSSVFVSPACVEAAYQPLPAYHETISPGIDAFFRSVTKAVIASGHSDLPEFETKIGLFELCIEGNSTDIMLSFRREPNGEVYLAAPDDWS